MMQNSTKLRRLAAMPLAEIAGRGRQEAAKVIGALARHRGCDSAEILQRHAPAIADPAAILDMLREEAPRRFFAGVEKPSDILRAMPDHCAEVVAAADKCLQGSFDLLGFRSLSFGDPIDWHLDPVSGRRAPNVYWSRINALDPQAVGDSKVVWELNRHQWIVRLAQAHAVTGDERYAEAALAAIESWLDANPAGIGINWSSSLEVSYRLMSWSWMLVLLRDSLALTGDRAVQIISAIWQQARHVSRYLSHYFSPNTHLTGEALGLFYVGSVFREFDEADYWRHLGAAILVEQSRAQICADGVHFERSTCYHRYTAETYQQFVLLAGRNQVTLPRGLTDRLQHVVEFLLALRQPDGLVPEIGDADGGSLVPIVRRSQCDPSGVLAVAAAMSARSDFAWAAGGPAPDVHWLMGSEGAGRFRSLTPAIPSGKPSHIFPSGGYAVLRSGWDRDAHQMTIDVGPLGCSYAAGHGHADLLSVNCVAFGEPCLVDAGTYCYTAEPAWRNYFRGTKAHNTLNIDSLGQADVDGIFSWRSKPAATLREWQTTSAWDFVDAHHEAYAGRTHRRRVLFRKPSYWIVVDDVEPGSDPEAALELTFQLAPMEVIVEDETWIRAKTPAGNTLWLGTWASAPIRTSIKCGELTPIRGWVSTDYGRRTPAPILLRQSVTSVPWRAVTVILPVRGVDRTVPSIEPCYGLHDLPVTLDVRSFGESVSIHDGPVTVRPH